MPLSDLKDKVEESKLPYTVPKEGWTCFHCGENFKDFKKAQEHFGLKRDMTSICIVKLCKDKCSIMELRKAERLAHERGETIKELETQLNELRAKYEMSLRDKNK